MHEGAEPLYRQIAALIEDSIVEGALKPGQQAPSMNELAAFHHINPATARKGLGLLLIDETLEKRRGRGMFVTPQAKDRILSRRRERMAEAFLVPLIDEAVKLGVTRTEVHELLDAVGVSRGLYG